MIWNSAQNLVLMFFSERYIFVTGYHVLNYCMERRLAEITVAKYNHSAFYFDNLLL